MASTRVSRFKGGFAGTTYLCRSCGKRTRETGEGESSVELCAACYDDAGWENLHSDQHGAAEAKDPSCPYCQAEAKEASKS